MTSKKKTKKYIYITLTLLIAIIGISIAIFLGSVYSKVEEYDTKLSSNLWINHIDVGGLTPEEATQKLENEVLSVLTSQEIELANPKTNESIIFTYEDLGVTYNLDEVISEAALIGHEGNIWERYQALKNPPTDPIHLSLSSSFDPDQLEGIIAPQLESFYKAPVDAKMERRDRAFHITPEIYGYKADVASTVDQVLELLSKDQVGTIDVPLVPLNPKYTKENIKDLQTPLASYSTSYDNADLKRNANVELASKKINTVVMPDEKFMFSKQLEPITLEAGYQMAKVILNGNFDEGIGGGICQVSSTLYNALIQTDIDIYMRRNHSLPVSYVPLGQDATYATDSVDFQFINNTGHPLYVESYCENNKVYVNLYGHKDFKPTYETKFESELVETIDPPPTRYEEDPTLSPGTEIQKVRPKSGKKIVLYKLYYQNGTLIKKEKLNTSVYKAQGEVIRRGPKPAEQKATATTP